MLLLGSLLSSAATAGEETKAVGVEVIHAADHLGGQRYALIIGIDDYADAAIPDLAVLHRSDFSHYVLIGRPDRAKAAGEPLKHLDRKLLLDAIAASEYRDRARVLQRSAALESLRDFARQLRERIEQPEPPSDIALLRSVGITELQTFALELVERTGLKHMPGVYIGEIQPNAIASKSVTPGMLNVQFMGEQVDSIDALRQMREAFTREQYIFRLRVADWSASDHAWRHRFVALAPPED